MVKEINTHSNNKDFKNRKNKNKKYKPKLTNEMILEKLNFSFTRDAEWYKKTTEKIEQVKTEMDKKFYTPEKKNQKIDFIHKLRNKLKDYKDALNFAEKYKKIRFFERRKLERMLTKIKKEILNYDKTNEDKESTEYKEKIKEMENKKESIETDINYVKFYPKSYKYYSLFPNNDKDNPETLKKIDKMRRKIAFYVNKKSKTKDHNDSDSSDDEEEEGGEIVNDVEIKNENNETEVNTNSQTTNVKTKSSESTKIKKSKKNKFDSLDYEKEGKKYSKNEKIEEDDFFIMD